MSSPQFHRKKVFAQKIFLYSIAAIISLILIMGIFWSSADDTVTEPFDSYTLIDVRSKEEWDGGHVNGAILIPHTQISSEIAEKVPDKTRPIKVYCRSGHRAGIALNALKELGYENVQNLGGFGDAQRRIKDAPAQ